jgi:hypothetical protein
MQGKDLGKLFPQVEKITKDFLLNADPTGTWFLVFKRMGNKGGNYLRVRGEIEEIQMRRLRSSAKVPRIMTPATQNNYEVYQGQEPEFAIFETLNFSNGEELRDCIADLNFDDPDSLAFVDGKFLKMQDLQDCTDETHNGSFVVLIQDYFSDPGSSLPFVMMPHVKVYVEELDGPFEYPQAEDGYPNQVYDHAKVARAWNLKYEDSVICPRCGISDCNDHMLRHGDKAYIRREQPKGKQFLFEFAAPGLLGTDASTQLARFALAVMGKKVDPRGSWPEEIAFLYIDGENHTWATCDADIEQGSLIEVVLASKGK